MIGSHQLPSSIGGNTSTTVLRPHSLHTVGGYKSKNWVVLHQSPGVLTIILVGAALRISPEIFSTAVGRHLRRISLVQSCRPNTTVDPRITEPRVAETCISGSSRRRFPPTKADDHQVNRSHCRTKRIYLPAQVRYNPLKEYGDRTI